MPHYLDLILQDKEPQLQGIEPRDIINTEDDIIRIRDNILYQTGYLFLLQPFINNPANENCTYHQSTFDARFLFYVDSAYQSIYCLWDRIGDLLNIYFNAVTNNRSDYFGKILDNIHSAHKQNINYINLDIIRDNLNKTIFSIRHNIVHRKTTQTQFFNDYFFDYHFYDKDKIFQSKWYMPYWCIEQTVRIKRGFYYAAEFIRDCATPK